MKSLYGHEGIAYVCSEGSDGDQYDCKLWYHSTMPGQQYIFLVDPDNTITKLEDFLDEMPSGTLIRFLQLRSGGNGGSDQDRRDAFRSLIFQLLYDGAGRSRSRQKRMKNSCGDKHADLVRYLQSLRPVLSEEAQRSETQRRIEETQNVLERNELERRLFEDLVSLRTVS